jgi:hypothetical protein
MGRSGAPQTPVARRSRATPGRRRTGPRAPLRAAVKDRGRRGLREREWPGGPAWRAQLNAPGFVRRMAAVLVTPGVRAAAPPGIDPVEFGLALVEDSCDLTAELELVAPAIAVSHDAEQELGGRAMAEFAWPGTPVLRLKPADDAGLGLVGQTLHGLAALGAQQAVVLAADAPDLPALLIGKLLRALGSTPRQPAGSGGSSSRAGSPGGFGGSSLPAGRAGVEVAICPAEGGGLVALAAWLPPAGWVAGMGSAGQPGDCRTELDRLDAVDRLRRCAPRRGALQVVPGWHRLRSPADVGSLDPGLEGWPATRGVLWPPAP